MTQLELMRSNHSRTSNTFHKIMFIKIINPLFAMKGFNKGLYNKISTHFFSLEAHHSDSVDLPVVQYVEVNQ